MHPLFKALLVLSGLVLLSGSSKEAAAQRKGSAAQIKAMVSGIHKGVNHKRSIYNQPALALSDSASTMAELHSLAMANGVVGVGHSGFSDRSKIIRRMFNASGAVAENVAVAVDAQDAVEIWWTSEGHKDNMLGDYNTTGIGVARKGGMWYCTQIFFRK